MRLFRVWTRLKSRWAELYKFDDVRKLVTVCAQPGSCEQLQVQMSSLVAGILQAWSSCCDCAVLGRRGLSVRAHVSKNQDLGQPRWDHGGLGSRLNSTNSEIAQVLQYDLYLTVFVLLCEVYTLMNMNFSWRGRYSVIFLVDSILFGLW